MHEVVVGFTALTNSENKRDDNNGKPYKQKLLVRLPEQEIQNRKHQENREDIGNFVSKNQKLLFQALTGWFRFEWHRHIRGK